MRASLLLIGLLLAGASFAAPQWNELTPPQQALLAAAIRGHAPEFNALPEARRDKLAEGARRWLAMSPEQRGVASQQLGEWQRMSKAERQAALAQRERFRKLPAANQQALLQRHREFLALPASEQQRLHQRFEREQELLDHDAPFSSPLGNGLPLPQGGGLLPHR